MSDDEMMPESGRQAAHVLLDAAASWDWDDSTNNDDAYVARANLALERLDEVGAVRATLHDDTLDLDATPLIGGALLSIHWLAGHLAAAMHVDKLEVYSRLRAFLDTGAAWHPGSNID
jgi:hypothetical protein